MQAINQITTSLRTKLDGLNATNILGGREFVLSIVTAHELLLSTKELCKSLNNQMLADFFTANIFILNQLQIAAQNQEEDATIIVKSSDVMLQLSHIYQDAIVPLLTRLHNLSDATSDIHKITAITSLGNEIITLSGQINQFNEKFDLSERMYTMFGIILLLSSISMLVVILSKSNLEIPVVTPLTIMSLGCGICAKAMQSHKSDPGTDLITTSLKKIEPLIYDVAKSFDENQVEEVANAVTKSPKQTKVKKPPSKKTQQMPEELEPTSQQTQNATLIGKIIGVFDIFTTKK